MKVRFSLLTACFAFITITSSTSVSKTYDINFDDRTVVPGLPLGNAAGIEDTIFFNSWVINVPGDVNLLTHSPPNEIVTAAEQQATNGTPSLTALYPGSQINSFDLESFFFGCALDTAEGAVGVAVKCTVTVAGFQNGQEVAVASYTFAPPAGNLSPAMIQAVLPAGFVLLQNVTLIQGDPVVQVLAADDFVVTTHS